MVVRGASRNVTIERCRFVDCDMGITLGDSADLSRSVQGGLIRANFIKGHSGSGSAITINGAQGITIDHNTIYSPGGASPRSIDVRFSQSLGDGATDNLMDEVIEQRDGVLALFTEGNLEHIPASSFRNAGLGDLHLVAGSAAIDAAAGAQEEDIDCQALTDGHPDVGADEYVPSSGAETLAGRLPREIDYDAIGNTVVVRGLGGRDVAVRAVDMMGNSVAEISGCVGERLRLPSLGRGIYMLVARGRRGEAISRKVVVEGGR